MKWKKREYIEVEVKPTATETWTEMLCIAGVIIGILVLYSRWEVLPHKIPSHFGADNKPNAWAEKWILLINPIVALITYIFLSIAVRYPRLYNYPFTITKENAQRQYELARTLVNWMKVEVIYLMLYIGWASSEIALEHATALHPLFTPMFFVILFGSIIFYVIKAYQAR